MFTVPFNVFQKNYLLLLGIHQSPLWPPSNYPGCRGWKWCQPERTCTRRCPPAPRSTTHSGLEEGYLHHIRVRPASGLQQHDHGWLDSGGFSLAISKIQWGSKYPLLQYLKSKSVLVFQMAHILNGFMSPPAISTVFPFRKIMWLISMRSILVLKALILKSIIKSALWNCSELCVIQIHESYYSVGTSKILNWGQKFLKSRFCPDSGYHSRSKPLSLFF